MVRVFSSVDDLSRAVGEHLGYSSWHTITQEAVQLFADATGDHQWIHTDPLRAASGPFGTTIAHGYYTLALVPKLVEEIYRVDNSQLVINYGCDRLRFPAAVLVGSTIRAGAQLLAVRPDGSGTRVTDRVTVEIQNGNKPACIVDSISIYLPA